jgi:UDP-glucuronate 4-epimerase
MTVLVTGAAGFIGSALVLRLLDRGDHVVGLDNHNTFYDPALKEARIAQFIGHPNYHHLRLDISSREAMYEVFKAYNFNQVVHLAGQAGVRFSLENPSAYIDSNILGFANILEGARNADIKHLVYASSSSVYGANTRLPFSVDQNVDHPLSLYAATKKSNELMAHSYSHLYGLPTTGLRFFTVYGPWGRPDMALFKFAEAISSDQPLTIFNHGKHRRDFTYIDDIVEGIVRVLAKPATGNTSWSGTNPDPGSSTAPYRIYNIGNSHPVELMDYIEALERALGKVAKKHYLPTQPGDVPHTHADVTEFEAMFGYAPTTGVEEGVIKFVDWYKKYFSVTS